MQSVRARLPHRAAEPQKGRRSEGMLSGWVTLLRWLEKTQNTYIYSVTPYCSPLGAAQPFAEAAKSTLVFSAVPNSAILYLSCAQSKNACRISLRHCWTY